MAADLVAEEGERRLDRDRVRRDGEQLVDRRELTVDRPRPLDVARVRGAHLLGDLRPDDVGVDADAADRAELEERLQHVVVPRVEVEAGRDDVAGLARSGFACLTARTVSISASRLIVSGSMFTTTRAGML